MHWGLYALHGRNDNGPYVSWAMENEGITVEDYSRYADRFNPQKFDAGVWMRLAKDAGAKYLTFTSKHHEGFSMFDSGLTDYDSVDRAAQRDFVDELVVAARENDMKIAFYYSMLDWHHQEFKTELAKYVDEFLFELCTQYGSIDGLWFDGEWDHPAETWRADELVRMIRALQPNALINDRLGKGMRGETPFADFYTREQMSEIGSKTVTEGRDIRPWEACLTIGKSWGYRRNDGPLKDSSELIRTLVDVVSRGGNLLLNVGPTPDGEIPASLATRLREVGDWLAVNGDGIYGTRRADGLTTSHGKLTVKEDRMFIHLEDRPADTVTISGLARTITGVTVLSTGEPLVFDDASMMIRLPEPWPNSAVTTIAIALE